MCGINFILDKKKQLACPTIQAMNEATAHRGRACSASLLHEEAGRQLFFGHNRLKILDMDDRANQPMRSKDGRYILIYNGELYNYKTLKQDLQNKYPFRTQSDTEVLLYHLAEEVLGFDGHTLQGMFAFVWYDTMTQTLCYARDSAGVKPLYKFENDDYLILSSEIKGIFASGLVSKKLHVPSVHHYLAYRYAMPESTFFEAITPVSPLPCLPAPLGMAGKGLEEHLSNVVHAQTMGDVPFGIFLSGGVDSTLLLAMLQEQGHTQLPAFTIANTQQERAFGTDDFHFSKLAATQYQAQLHTVEVQATLLRDLPAFVQTLNQPIADVAYWLTQILAKEARKTVKFVFSGAGADELFAGYNRHQAIQYYQQYYGAMMLAYPFLKIGAQLLPTGFAHPLKKTFRLLKKFANDISISKEKTWDNFIRLTQHKTHQNHTQTFPFNPLLDDQQQYLQHDVLALNDHAGMHHELEIRVPYLDNVLLQYANSLSLSYKLQHGKKWLLKRLLEARAGKVYTQRRKEGFGIPVGKWLREKEGQPYIALLLDKKNYLQDYMPYKNIEHLVKKHIAQQQDYSSVLWAMLLLEMWLQQNF